MQTWWFAFEFLSQQSLQYYLNLKKGKAPAVVSLKSTVSLRPSRLKWRLLQGTLNNICVRVIRFININTFCCLWFQFIVPYWTPINTFCCLWFQFIVPYWTPMETEPLMCKLDTIARKEMYITCIIKQAIRHSFSVQDLQSTCSRNKWGCAPPSLRTYVSIALSLKRRKSLFTNLKNLHPHPPLVRDLWIIASETLNFWIMKETLLPDRQHSEKAVFTLRGSS